ncbi:MAG: asparagine synthetase A [Candidatus Methanofastidiosa archaeon]|nr:asparagine synthetase A [Candidatus Methanofastidiosa archaeon]
MLTNKDLMKEVTDYAERVSSHEMQVAMKVHTHVRRYLGDFLFREGFIEIPPVILSPITDPLNHPTLDPTFTCYGHNYQLTKSMIFHKQLAVLGYDKIFSFSPNLRFEPLERVKSGRHLFEFTQLDLEVRNASRDDVMALMERMYAGLMAYCVETLKDDLASIGRTLTVPAAPFRRVGFLDAKEQYGESFENDLSRDSTDPLWIVDIPLLDREFYDREDPERPNILLDMDLLYPEGYGEASSGGEREWEYAQIMKRIEKKEQDPLDFCVLVDLAQEGKIVPSAGFGIGIERLVRYICGFDRIEMAALFPKVPGKLCI